jgi:hypothetical protein
MAKESKGQAASRNQIIIAGVALVALLGVVYFMFLRGGEEPTSAAAPAPAAEATPAEEPKDKDKKDEAKAPKKKSKGPVETSKVFGGKDPFEAVLDLTADNAGGGGGTVEGVTDDGTVTTTDDGTVPTAPTVPIAPTPPPPDDDDDEVKTGYRVELVDIATKGGTRTAMVETVNRATGEKVVHKVNSGERFRKHFKLTSMDNRCANFMFGDDWFALCEGQHVRKQ